MGLLDKYVKFCVKFKIETPEEQWDVKCTTGWVPLDQLNDQIETIEDRDYEILSVKAKTDHSLAPSVKEFDLEELREPVL